MLHLTKRTRRAAVAVTLAAIAAVGAGFAGTAAQADTADRILGTPPTYPDPVPTGTVADWAYTAPFVGWAAYGDALPASTAGSYTTSDTGLTDTYAGTREFTDCLASGYPLRAGQTGAELAAGSQTTVWMSPGEFPEVNTVGPVLGIYQMRIGPARDVAGSTITVDIMNPTCAARWGLAGPIYLNRANPTTGVVGANGTTDSLDPITARGTTNGEVVIQGISGNMPAGSWPTFAGVSATGWALTTAGTQVPFSLGIQFVDDSPQNRPTCTSLSHRAKP